MARRQAIPRGGRGSGSREPDPDRAYENVSQKILHLLDKMNRTASEVPLPAGQKGFELHAVQTEDVFRSDVLKVKE